MGWLVPLVPLLAATVLGVAGSVGGTAPPRRRLAGIAAAAMAATIGLALAGALHGWTGELAWSDSLVLRLDYGLGEAPAAGLFAIFVPLVALPVVVYAAAHERSAGLARLMSLLVFSVGLMEVIAGASDLLALLVGWELIGACSTLLVGHDWRRPGTPRAATVVFLTTRTGDLGLFLAAAAAWAGARSFDYVALGSLDGPLLALVAGGVLAAATAKSAQLPFAPWLFAAMKGPVSVSSLLHAVTMVASGAFLLVRLRPILERVPWFSPAVLATGLVTALAAGAVALLQPHAKRLLAGSTSAHYGLMFVAVGAGYPAIAMLHLVAHAFAKSPLFLVSGLAEARTGGYRLAGMGLRRMLPGMAIASAVVAAAIGGLPPLGAAWTKDEIVSAAGHAGPWAAGLVALAGLLSAAYMTRFQLQAFGTTSADGAQGSAGREHGGRSPEPSERGAVYALVAGALVLSLLWLPGVHRAAAGLLGGTTPSGTTWELIASLALVALGGVAGALLALRRPALGEAGAVAVVAAWLGLPAMARIFLAGLARTVAATLARFDEVALDAAVRRFGRLAVGIARFAAWVDDVVVDGALRALAAAATRLAALGRRLVETLFDGLPEGLSRLTGRAGALARRLQTGFTHQYYALILTGLGLVLALLILGA